MKECDVRSGIWDRDVVIGRQLVLHIQDPGFIVQYPTQGIGMYSEGCHSSTVKLKRLSAR